MFVAAQKIICPIDDEPSHLQLCRRLIPYGNSLSPIHSPRPCTESNNSGPRVIIVELSSSERGGAAGAMTAFLAIGGLNRGDLSRHWTLTVRIL